jgi:peptidoglycan/xylan/chitin deacetylase (PgdA/CDA1 family)
MSASTGAVSSIQSALRRFRKASFAALNGSRVTAAVASSAWRRKRLLVLCYHGIAIADEHEWLPRTYMTQSTLRARFEILRDFGCAVLPLGEAVTRLYAGTLPAKAVAITFDDGGYDFYCRAFPVVREFDFPVTVYQTTYYADFPKPIFNLACSYMLWKSRHRALAAGTSFGLQETVRLDSEANRRLALQELLSFAEKEKLSGAGKDELAQYLAQALGFDYSEFLARRLLQLMTPAEIAELSGQGIDFELHTHRHRTPDSEESFRQEIRDNRQRLREMTGRDAVHFCYPSGVFHLKNLPWLAAERVVSATTCQPHLASRASHALLLPRLVDTSAKSPLEFETWLSGVASLMTLRRPARADAPYR